MSIPSIAKLVGISKSTLYVMISRGQLKAKRIGFSEKGEMRCCVAWVHEAIEKLRDV